MAKKVREKMSRLNRAKQFAPFAALGGLEEALERVRIEKGYVEKRTMSEEDLNELDYKLSLINEGDLVTINYYKEGNYLDIRGVIMKIDRNFRYFIIDEETIDFTDVYEIDI